MTHLHCCFISYFLVIHCIFGRSILEENMQQKKKTQFSDQQKKNNVKPNVKVHTVHMKDFALNSDTECSCAEH